MPPRTSGTRYVSARLTPTQLRLLQERFVTDAERERGTVPCNAELLVRFILHALPGLKMTMSTRKTRARHSSGRIQVMAMFDTVEDARAVSAALNDRAGVYALSVLLAEWERRGS